MTNEPLTPERLAALGLQSMSSTAIRRRPDPATPAPTKTARSWLVEYLTAAGGSAELSVVLAAAQDAGVRRGTLYRCRLGAGVCSESSPGQFPRRAVWSIATARPAMSRSGLDRAGEWLAGYLADHGGGADRSDIVEAGRIEGIGARMLIRAHARAGVAIETVPGSFPRRTRWVLSAP